MKAFVQIYTKGSAMIKLTLGIFVLFPHTLFANAYIDLLTQEIPSLWVSLFALAIISMMSLYLSSEQLKELHKKHKLILEKEKEIEKKQQFILEFMGEKIETSTKGIIKSRKNLEKNLFVENNPSRLKQEIVKFQENEALLLDATEELIDFLKIKSGTLVLKEESYKVSNILNETLSIVHDDLQRAQTELIYDISPNVSEVLIGDSRRLEQIISTLLLNALEQGKIHSEIILKISLETKKSKKLTIDIFNKQKVMLKEEIAVLLENYTLKEEYKSQDKLYMYIAYQLIAQMKGDIRITSSKENGTQYHMELPYRPSFSLLKRIKTLKTYDRKRIFLGIDNVNLSKVIVKRLEEADVAVTTWNSKQEDNVLPNVLNYDACIFDGALLNKNLMSKLELLNTREKQNIFILKNLYENKDDKILLRSYQVIYKPLLNTQISNILECALVQKDGTDCIEIKDNPIDDKVYQPTLLKNTEGITRESFKQFSHLHILIVEDNSMNQKILKGVFSQSGMTLSIANNGLEALKEVEKNSELDLIFMDTNMPVMDGYEATKKIRLLRNINMLPIIAIDSIGFRKGTADVSGINAFLHKPFQIGQLYTALATYTSYKHSTVKHVTHKLKKYEPNKDILDIQKGISHANTAIFYKEVLRETFVTLKESGTTLEVYIAKRDYKPLKSFVLDTLSLAEIIGASGLRKILIEMMQTFDYKQENSLPDYIPLYKKELKVLKSEINTYLKT